MQSSENRNNDPQESRRYDLPCEEWRVDEPVWIDIRGAQVWEIGVARRVPAENMASLGDAAGRATESINRPDRRPGWF